MLKIKRIDDFDKMLEELCKEEVDILPMIKQRIKWFQKNPNDTRLDNHSLSKRLTGKYAFSIDDDIRIIYEKVGKSTVRFLAIGRHGKVYRKKSN